ncbi:MAG: XrtA/PEP-CTERM system-associated ATPase [Usitatibacteraceae bacterium]
MYESFYGLTKKPFQLNPDPSFYFGSRQHRRAMAYLEYGLHQNEGFIVITGEVGAGKTTLVRNLFSKLDPDQVVAANLVSTQLDADDTLRMVASAFGIPTTDSDKSNVLLSLEAFLVSVAKQGKRCLLVVDEAQNLTARAVEELRMLSNFQLETHALLQSFLIGQPEFRHILQSPQMQQLRQRVIAACHIGPMDEEETQGYVEHRLHCVGWKDSPQFEAGAYQAIFQASGGVPRRINAVCDRLLLSGFLSEKRLFTREDVNEVSGEMSNETLAPKHQLSDPALRGPTRKSPEPGLGELRIRSAGADDDSQRDPQQLAFDLSRNDMAARWMRVEESMLRLERTMVRLERSHSASLDLLIRLVDELPRHGTDS